MSGRVGRWLGTEGSEEGSFRYGGLKWRLFIWWNLVGGLGCFGHLSKSLGDYRGVFGIVVNSEHKFPSFWIRKQRICVNVEGLTLITDSRAVD